MSTNLERKVDELTEKVENLSTLIVSLTTGHGSGNSGGRKPKFLPTCQAAIELEGAINEKDRNAQRRLTDKVKGGLYRIGKEVVDRRQPKAKYPVYFFDIEACVKRDRAHSGDRK